MGRQYNNNNSWGRGGGWQSNAWSGRNEWGKEEAGWGKEEASWQRTGGSRGQAASRAAGSNAKETQSSPTVQRCNSAKRRLNTLREGLEEAQLKVLKEAVEQKSVQLPDSLVQSGLEASHLEDLRFVLKNDHWDAAPIDGKQWLAEWLDSGQYWAEMLREAEREKGNEHWCVVCKRSIGRGGWQRHLESKEYAKKVRLWVWRMGCNPPSAGKENVPGQEGATESSSTPAVKAKQEYSPDGLAGDDELPAVVRAPEKRYGSSKSTSGQLLLRARQTAQELPAIAKQKLLEFRNNLSEEERRDVVARIGLPRANDVADLSTFESIFKKQVYSWMCSVKDENWLWKEPTFSWLTGFYWHPECTRVGQAGPTHSELYCHLCEVDSFDSSTMDVHVNGRRHAEAVTAWVERMGATPIPTSCQRCPTAEQAMDDRGYYEGPPLDIDYGCPEQQAAPPEESSPPVGFTSLHEIEQDRPGSFPYAAFVLSLNGGSRSRHGRKNGGASQETWSAVKVASHLKIGPKVKTVKRGPVRWGVDLQEPLDFGAEQGAQWRSLAIPLRGKDVYEGSKLDFSIFLQHAGSEDLEDAGTVSIIVPAVGHVVVADVEVPAQGYNGWDNNWGGRAWLRSSSRVSLQSFVASGQIQAFGGTQALRGSQRAFQLATEEMMLSFLLYLPVDRAPCPVLVFLHGDLPRESPQCPMPGLADFVGAYGPADLCGSRTRKGVQVVKSFAVVTPCSPAEFWWFRHPAVHDSTTYVPATERWFRRLAAWLEEDLGVSVPRHVSAGNSDGGIRPGLRLAGQSMGGYAALEAARAMPEMVSAVACGAPCFDACRLDWLAERLRGVPLWVMIGRQDAMCAFEECASLILKMRDRRARCVRLTSLGIKGHNEAFKFLEKQWLYRWLLEPT